MDTVKIKDIKTGATKEVLKELAADFIGTGQFEIVKEEKTEKKEETKSILPNKD